MKTFFGNTRCNILVVDDHHMMCDFLARYLQDKGHKVHTIEDAVESEVVSWLEANPCHGVILDVNMPRCNGVSLLDRIRKNKRTSHVPVVIITAETDGNVVEACKEAGANGFISKACQDVGDIYVSFMEAIHNLAA